MSIQGTPSTPIIIVDDRDDNIVYKGHWNQDDDSSDFKILFDGTGTYGVDVGANASFTFVGEYPLPWIFHFANVLATLQQEVTSQSTPK